MTNSTQADGGLKARLDFIGFDRQSLSTLAALQPFVGRAIHAALEAFYDKARATPEMRKLFADENHIAAAKKRPGNALDIDRLCPIRRELRRRRAQDRPNPCAHRARAPMVHRRLRADRRATDPRPRQGTMAEPSNTGEGRAEGVAEALSALVKAAMLDMDFAISVYLDTLDEQRRRAEEERAAVEREGAIAVDAIAAGLAKLAAKDLTSRITSDLPRRFARRSRTSTARSNKSRRRCWPSPTPPTPSIPGRARLRRLPTSSPAAPSSRRRTSKRRPPRSAKSPRPSRSPPTAPTTPAKWSPQPTRTPRRARWWCARRSRRWTRSRNRRNRSARSSASSTRSRSRPICSR